MNEIIDLLKIIAIGTSVTGIYFAGKIFAFLFLGPEYYKRKNKNNNSNNND